MSNPLVATRNLLLQQFVGSLSQQERERVNEALRALGYDLSRYTPLDYVLASVTFRNLDTAASNGGRLLGKVRFTQGAVIIGSSATVVGCKFDAQSDAYPDPVEQFANLDLRDVILSGVQRTQGYAFARNEVTIDGTTTPQEAGLMPLSHWCGKNGQPYIWPKVIMMTGSDELIVTVQPDADSALLTAKRVTVGFHLFQAPIGVQP